MFLPKRSNLTTMRPALGRMRSRIDEASCLMADLKGACAVHNVVGHLGLLTMVIAGEPNRLGRRHSCII
jgi:hypothetical protein